MTSPHLSNRQHRPAATRLMALAAVLVAVACQSPEPAAAEPPIRLVRVGHGRVDTLKENIEVSVAGCFANKGLPPAPVPMPSDDELAKLAMLEAEELFAGDRWALYTTERTVAADPNAGCRPALYVARSVTIEHACSSRIEAATTQIPQLLNGEPNAPWVRTTPPAARCNGRRKPADARGLPVESAGPVSCVWNSALIQKASGGLIAVDPADAGNLDFCLYAGRPEVSQRGVIRPVVVKTRTSNRTLDGGDLTRIVGVAQAANQDLVSFTEGSPIPDDRFTEAAANAFVRQPVKLAIGGKP